MNQLIINLLQIYHLLPAISALENADTIEERIGRIRQIRTDFFT
jgi:hypothetical protein